MLGMTLAWRLRQLGYAPTVLDASPQAGGLAASQRIGDYTWDRFYHVILLSDANLRGLLEELDLADRLRWRTTRTGFYVDGRLFSLSTSLDFLKFPPLSVLDTVRLGITVLAAARRTDGRPLESVLVTDWLRRWSGRRTFERLWLPLLESKLGENYRVASAAFIWAIIARMYAARRSGLKREMFGYVEGGYGTVLERFTERLRASGVELECGCAVTRVEDQDEHVDVVSADGTRRQFDRVVLTMPSPRIVATCPQLTAAERARLNKVVYQGVICGMLLLRRPLAGYYVTNLTDPALPFTGVIEMTALVGEERFGGHSLVYLPRYLAQDDPYWQRDDAGVRTDFIAGLTRMYPDLRPDDVQAFELSRARQVMAVSTLRYSAEVLPPLRTSMPNVFVVNSTQIANGTLNVNETVGLANAQAAALARELEARPARPSPAQLQRAAHR